ncbi:hypothetical protein [Dyella japonica]|uniref:Uncharacterized protein n=1 Tax=Dyella japonica TaxID=231455 RepID=A0ABV2JW18_9GAMM
MADLLQILQHSLGVDQFGRGSQYRNHFVTGEGSQDHRACMELVAKGLMTRRLGNALSGGDDVFFVTATGIDYVAVNSPAPPPTPKLTRSQKRYQAFLRADTGLSFAEWIGVA